MLCKCIGHLIGVRWLEGHSALLSRLSEGNAELKKLEDHIGEVFEEELLVRRVLLDVCLECLVGYECHVGRQHHQGLAGLVLILFGLSAIAYDPGLQVSIPVWAPSIFSSSSSRSTRACSTRLLQR